MTKESDWAQKKLRKLLSNKRSPVSGAVRRAVETEEEIERNNFWNQYRSK